MPSRRCLGCGRLTVRSRCSACAGRRKAVRNAHAAAARAIVAEHRATVGDLCPGWGRPPHASEDLTAEHSTPISQGGQVDGVLCRRCNASKGAR